MNLPLINHIASPLTHHSLRLQSQNQDGNLQKDFIDEGMLWDENTNDTFPVIEGVPMLEPPGDIADWSHNVLEILFGKQTQYIIEEIYEKTKASDNYVTEIKKYIKDSLGVEGVKKAFKEYSQLPQQQRLEWFYQFDHSKCSIKSTLIPSDALENGRKYGTIENGKLRAEQCESMFRKWATHIPRYVSKVMEGEPPVIVELSTGAGLGTLGLIKSMSDKSMLISIDIDFSAVKNAEGLAKFYGIEDRVDPVVANFWFLPFNDNSIDTICSHYGLDESREVPRVISEVSRVLSNNGKFINVSRGNPEFRLLTYLDDLGLSNDELCELALMAGLYAGVDETVRICTQNGLILDDQIVVSPENSHERVISIFMKSKR